MSLETTNFVNDYYPKFAQVAELAGHITRQNTYYDARMSSGQVTDPVLRQGITDHFGDWQTVTLHEIAEALVSLPYERIVVHEQHLYNEIKATTVGLADRETDAILGSLGLIYQVAVINSIDSDYQIEAAQVNYQDEHEDPSHAAMITQRQQLIADYRDLMGLYALAGKAWDIPDPFIEQDFMSDVVIDSFPERSIELAQVAQRVKRKYPEDIQKDASGLIALVLLDRPGQVFTNGDLATIIHEKNTPRDRKRINARIWAHDHEESAIIKDLLADAGLVLQQGVRIVVDNDGRQIARMKIYRAIAPGQETIRERTISYGGNSFTETWS